MNNSNEKHLYKPVTKSKPEMNNASLLKLLERSINAYVKSNYSPDIQEEWEIFSYNNLCYSHITVVEFIDGLKKFPPFVNDLELFSQIKNIS